MKLSVNGNPLSSEGSTNPTSLPVSLSYSNLETRRVASSPMVITLHYRNPSARGAHQI